MSLKLYGYWRSGATYRVRLALHLKGLKFDYQPVHLVKDGGEQHQQAYQQMTPTELVPTLVDGDMTLHQSPAILEYLEERYPQPALLPEQEPQRSLARALALDMACDLQPLNNLRVLQYLTNDLALNDEQKQAWIAHWTKRAFTALEQSLSRSAGRYCVGDQVTFADVCLLPQVYHAQRFKVALDDFPTLMQVHHNLQQLPAVIASRPENQPDAQ
ncbi:maleylacetoacetate isomerase [Idiomarina xiamenensis]|uniref:Glutathione S-transferase-like protein n=1 Tax=Idiomarina xiamenensis 10-D-4 TaxID=740709 RepID=K2KAC3_9GAMM|nr:maleylacetoacetate isomerase [Idiomarina xiamenensis]EKE84753.1 glutathione S-transferase-like protein [Idiomarina xiamenensis 10-D-4]